jgi:hypothetical protein
MATYHMLPHTASVVRMLNGQDFISGRRCNLSFKQMSSEVQLVLNPTKNQGGKFEKSEMIRVSKIQDGRC